MNTFQRFAVYATIIIAAWMVLTPPAKADDAGWWVVATVRSYHYDRSVKHNEDNYGLGVEKRIADNWTATAGYYENSYSRRSVYVGANWLPLHAGYFHLGLAMGGVDGYGSHPFGPYLFPVLAFQGKEYGLNLAVVPSVSGNPYTVIGLQLKARF